MSKKILDAKTIFDIILLGKCGIRNKDIMEKYPEISFPTISRITMRSASAAEKYIRYNEFLKSHKSFEDFMDEFWKDFPQPEYWPTEVVNDIWRFYTKHNILATYKEFELNFSYGKFIELFELKKLKKVFDKNNFGIIPKTKDEIIKEVKKENKLKECGFIINEIETDVAKGDKEDNVKDLIERLKSLTGAAEVILKF